MEEPDLRKMNREDLLAFNLGLFARSLGGHLLMADEQGQVLRGPLNLTGVCAWTCKRMLEPCRSTCLRPAARLIRHQVMHFARCPLGLTIFSLPLRLMDEAVGYLAGGGLAPSPGFRPDLSALAGSETGQEAVKALEMLAPSHRVSSSRDLASVLAGVKASLQAILGSFHQQDLAEKRVRQVEGLATTAQGFYSELPPGEWTQSFLQTISTLFDIPALFVTLPRPFLPGLYLLDHFGDERLLPGRKGSNLPESFPDPAHLPDEPLSEEDTLRIREWGFPPGARSVSLFPIRSAGRTMGVMASVNRLLDREESTLVGNFVAAFALNLLVRRMESTTEELLEEREYLYALVQDLLKEREPEGIYGLLLKKVSSITGAERASLMLLDEEGGLTMKKAMGFDDSALADLRVLPGEGIAGKVLQSGHPLWVRDIDNELSEARPRRSQYKTGSFISFPLVAAGKAEGVLNVSDKETGTSFTRKDFDRLKIISEHTLLAVEKVRYLEQYRAALRQATLDPLTGLANRRYLVRRVETEMERCRRHGRELSLVMIDVDRFKEYNDLNGHLAGDEALRVISEILSQSIRSIDLAGRYGGEEFFLVLPEVGEEAAAAVAERVRSQVKRTIFPGEEGMTAGKLTVSLGVAGFPRIAGSAVDLIHASDMALYQAKRSGRDMVCRAEGPPPGPRHTALEAQDIVAAEPGGSLPPEET